MHYFSDLFDKILYIFRTGPLSIIRSISLAFIMRIYHDARSSEGQKSYIQI